MAQRILLRLYYLAGTMAETTSNGVSAPYTDEDLKEEKKPPPHPAVEALKSNGTADMPEKLIDMIEEDNSLLRFEDESGMNLLMHAAWTGKPKLCEYLLNMVSKGMKWYHLQCVVCILLCMHMCQECH